MAFSIPSIGADVSAVAAEVALVTQEFSHLMKELSLALANGVVEPHEWPPLARECDHLISELYRLREAAKAEAEK